MLFVSYIAGKIGPNLLANTADFLEINKKEERKNKEKSRKKKEERRKKRKEERRKKRKEERRKKKKEERFRTLRITWNPCFGQCWK